MANLMLGELIEWLGQQDASQRVVDGFGSPHSDRGSYCDLAFEPEPVTTFGAMLEHAKSALGQTFSGYKGGDYKMTEYTDVKIGHWGECGESITRTHLRYWLIATHQPKEPSDGR